MIRFIDEHQDRRTEDGLRWGIEPIAKVLGIAPSTYHAAKKRPPSARAMRDAELKPEILRVWEQNLSEPPWVCWRLSRVAAAWEVGPASDLLGLVDHHEV